ncbi:MAG: hypothetical protein ACK5G7_02740 [Erysipelotrichaceae bacterium]
MQSFLDKHPTKIKDFIQPIINYFQTEYPDVDYKFEDNKIEWAHKANTLTISIFDNYVSFYFSNNSSFKRVADNYSLASVDKDCINFQYEIGLPLILICSAIDISFDN